MKKNSSLPFHLEILFLTEEICPIFLNRTTNKQILAAL